MMTQSVITQAASLFGNATGSVTSKGKQTGSGFDLIIDSSVKAVQNTNSNTEKSTIKKDSLQKTDSKGSNKSDVTDQTTEQAEKVTNKDTTKVEDTKAAKLAGKQTENLTKTEDTTKSEDTELTTDEEVIAQIAGMLQSIRDAVMQILNLSSEELDQLMCEQGMSAIDLLQSENLQQIVLANNGETDILAILTDESMAGSLQQLLQMVDGIKEDANLQLTDLQMKDLMLQSQKQASTSNEVTGEQFITEEPDNPENNLTVQKDESAINVTKKNTEQSVDETSQQDNKFEVMRTAGTQESNTDTQSDTNRENRQDLKAEDQFQTFINNLVKTSQETQVDFSGNLVQVTELRDIANQIIERIKVSIQPDQTSMELQLNPENLGKVNLSLQSKNGVMTAQFVVQNEITKEAIESQLHTLRDTLNQQGIKVEAIEVTVSAYAFEQNTGESSDTQSDDKKSNSGKKITLEEALSMTEMQENVTDDGDITGVRGSQIDYTA